MGWSFAEVILVAVVVMTTHCYYGYTASGGPAGVGVAVGRAVRTALVSQVVLDFFLSLAIWGSSTTVRISQTTEVVISETAPMQNPACRKRGR